MNSKKQSGFARNLIGLAIVTAFGPTYAGEEIDIDKMTKPESFVSAGGGYITGDQSDRSLFDVYSGMGDNNFYGLLDISFVRRDEATGTWTNLEGTNLGLDNREIGFSQQRQGDWKYFIDYNELVTRDPRTMNSALQGSGSTTPTIVLLGKPGTGTDYDFELKRQAIDVGGSKWITPNLQFELSFRSEDKDGSRRFGNGFACTSGTAPGCVGPTAGNSTTGRTGWALLMFPEPINSNTKQVEAKLNYSGEKLALTGGYYGSFYSNSNGNIDPTVPSTLYNALGTPLPANKVSSVPAGQTAQSLQTVLGLPIALPPDNQAQQFYLSGNYAFTPTTRGTFKYAYTHATQSDSFLGDGLTGAPSGRSNLDGAVDTTLLQMGLTARPMPKLSLVATARYENKDDSTPIDYYNLEGTSRFTNSHVSNRKVGGKLEASYQFLPTTRATLGFDYQEVKRELPSSTTTVAGLSGLRGETTETGYRAEVRHSVNEELSGTLSYVSSQRKGSDWYSLCTTAACVAAGAGYGADVSAGTIVGASPNAIFPMTLTDRNRDKWRFLADWSPTDRFSLQLSVEDGTDNYTTAGTKGLQDTGMSFYNLDATWSIADNWKLSGYAAHGNQTMHVNHSTGYIADLKNSTDTFGLGLTGNPTSRLQVGADLSYTYEKDRYDQSLDPAASPANKQFLAASGGLPDVVYRLTTLKLFAKYALQKNSDLRFALVYQNAKLDEWSWENNGVPFKYSDNSTVSMNQNQSATFVGLTYIYRWQ